MDGKAGEGEKEGQGGREWKGKLNAIEESNKEMQREHGAPRPCRIAAASICFPLSLQTPQLHCIKLSQPQP